MTNLNIIPNFDKKTAKFDGVIAAGENIHVNISNIGGYIVGTENLRLRAVGSDGRTLAQFPLLGDESPNWVKDGDTIECDLNLNTVQMLDAVPPAARVMVLFVLDNPEDEILYFKSFVTVDHWPRRVGEEEPVDLGGYADFVKHAMQSIANAEEAVKNAERTLAAAEKIVDDFDTKADATALNAEVERAQDAEAALGEEIKKKVDAVEGKGLSTEDYTTAEKKKLGKAYTPDNPPPTPDLSDYAKKGDIPYALIELPLTDSINLIDRSISKVTADDSLSSITFVFPEKKEGVSRDFFLRLVITGETVPTLSFVELNGDAVSFDVDDESWAEIEQGVNILMFTDTEE